MDVFSPEKVIAFTRQIQTFIYDITTFKQEHPEFWKPMYADMLDELQNIKEIIDQVKSIHTGLFYFSLFCSFAHS